MKAIFFILSGIYLLTSLAAFGGNADLSHADTVLGTSIRPLSTEKLEEIDEDHWARRGIYRYAMNFAMAPYNLFEAVPSRERTTLERIRGIAAPTHLVPKEPEPHVEYFVNEFNTPTNHELVYSDVRGLNLSSKEADNFARRILLNKKNHDRIVTEYDLICFQQLYTYASSEKKNLKAANSKDVKYTGLVSSSLKSWEDLNWTNWNGEPSLCGDVTGLGFIQKDALSWAETHFSNFCGYQSKSKLCKFNWALTLGEKAGGFSLNEAQKFALKIYESVGIDYSATPSNEQREYRKLLYSQKLSPKEAFSKVFGAYVK